MRCDVAATEAKRQSALLLLTLKRAITKFAKRDLALHSVPIDGPRINDVQPKSLDLHVETELDLLSFDRSSNVGLAQRLGCVVAS